MAISKPARWKFASEVTAILEVPQPRMKSRGQTESGGGRCNCFGLAASQLTPHSVMLGAADGVCRQGRRQRRLHDGRIWNKVTGRAFAMSWLYCVVAPIPNSTKVLRSTTWIMKCSPLASNKRTLTLFPVFLRGKKKKKIYEKGPGEVFRSWKTSIGCSRPFVAQYRPSSWMCRPLPPARLLGLWLNALEQRAGPMRSSTKRPVRLVPHESTKQMYL